MAAKTTSKTRIGIFGFGRMGSALYELLKRDGNYSFSICSLGFSRVPGAKIVNDLQKLAEESDILFLAVKPQEFHALEKTQIKKEIPVISIMAGIKTDSIAKKLGVKKVIRTMPNLNLQIGRGVIGWFANKKELKTKELKNIKNIFDTLGYNFAVAQENMIDAVTAISGSGPAYVFLFIDALVRSAEKLGFDPITSREMVLETLEGSAQYVRKMKDSKMEELISAVKSKKGTTEAALNEIDPKKFYSLWQRATKIAEKRAKELSNQ